ncbi:MAG TPA: leucyl aminopeptidase [Candidatus Acidoferrales bacterium]|jgi:leucyl aminopeptidase|nr:leucyl aminopeptidase [Candidatus Acidoferrales bacterium]
MKITLDSQAAPAIETQALVAYVFEEEDPINGRVAELDKSTGGLLRRLAKSGELTGKSLEMTLIHVPSGIKAERLLLVGAGKKEKFSDAELRRLAGAALRFLKPRGVKRAAFLAREADANSGAAEAVAEGLLLADFEGDKYKTGKKDDAPVDSAALAGWPAGSESQQGIDRGRIIAEGQNFARELANEPSNKMTPTILADRAAAMAREEGLGCEVLDEKRIAELKMGALLSVAQGSVEPPRLIAITYTPSNAAPGAPVLGLVGKAVTFDTGGISIKPANDMDKMKFDMSGGAAMIGTMRALARLKPPIKVIAVVPATENMPGGKAQKPGDIQTAMSGKTIEVLNTDAEGRLILADGVTYARKLGCTHLVDAATLTGAIVVALAGINTGVFGTNQAFTDRILASARAAGDKMWPMPMDDEYREMIKGTMADIQNISSGKGGGAITGAMFIREFVDDVPWVHLDIAGTAWYDDAKPWMAKGATGVPVRTLVDLAMNFNSTK